MFRLETDAARLPDLLDPLFDDGLRVQCINVFDPHREHFLAAIARHLAIGLVDIQEPPFQIHQIKTINRRAENGRDFILRLLALGDVLRGPKYPDGLARGVALHLGRKDRHHPEGSIRPDDAVFVRLESPGLQIFFVGPKMQRQVVRMNQFGQTVERVLKGFRRHAVNPIRLWRPRHRAAPDVKTPIAHMGYGLGAHQLGLALAQRRLRLMPRHCIPDGAGQQVSTDRAFDEIILGALPDGGGRQLFILGAAQHDHRNLRHGLAQLAEGGQPLAVRQTQIQQNQMNVFAFEPGDCLGQPRHGLQLETHRPGRPQHLADKVGVRRVVLHHEDALGFAHLIHIGSVATGLSVQGSGWSGKYLRTHSGQRLWVNCAFVCLAM